MSVREQDSRVTWSYKSESLHRDDHGVCNFASFQAVGIDFCVRDGDSVNRNLPSGDCLHFRRPIHVGPVPWRVTRVRKAVFNDFVLNEVDTLIVESLVVLPDPRWSIVCSPLGTGIRSRRSERLEPEAEVAGIALDLGEQQKYRLCDRHAGRQPRFPGRAFFISVLATAWM